MSTTALDIATIGHVVASGRAAIAQGQCGGGMRGFAAARLMSPLVEKEYRRLGVMP